MNEYADRPIENEISTKYTIYVGCTPFLCYRKRENLQCTLQFVKSRDAKIFTLRVFSNKSCPRRTAVKTLHFCSNNNYE